MAKAKFIDSAKELEQQAKQLFERIKKTHTDMGTTLQEVRRAEGKLIEKEKAAEKERIETERAERLRELLASEGNLAFHVGEPDEVQSAVRQEEKLPQPNRLRSRAKSCLRHRTSRRRKKKRCRCIKKRCKRKNRPKRRRKKRSLKRRRKSLQSRSRKKYMRNSKNRPDP